MMKKRSSGVLLHISSLPGAYGIGDLGKGAYAFLDFLEAAGQKNWQILPIGITGYGDSPYQSFSAFAGNPYFIDLDELIDMGYLSEEAVKKADLGREATHVDYEKLYYNKMPLLKLAYDAAKIKVSHELERFMETERHWLKDFALFMALKSANGSRSWLEWPEEYRDRHSEAVATFEAEQTDEIGFWIFLQYFFFKQWHALKAVAASKNIAIIGDLPIYVAEDSADVWASPQLFKLDTASVPVSVSGCPPDAFSATGQLWGNPIYNWAHMADNGFKWWIQRIDYSLKLFDVIRIDHFRGFEAYWEIPYGDPTAEGGKWVKGPDKALFEAIKSALGTVSVIAEDLGYVTQEVIDLREFTGFPGMKVLEFAFDAREESDYLPHHYSENFVAYTGTHDNETVMGWMKDAAKADREYAKNYLKLTKDEGYNWGFIRGVWSSTAYLAVAQMQDFLGLDNRARMNFPSKLGGNWIWRITEKDLSDKLAEKMHEITALYGRL